MKAWQFFMLLFNIYFMPSLTKLDREVVAVVYLCIATMFIGLEALKVI